MPSRLESDIERRVVARAKLEGWIVLKLVALGHRGFPDRWFIKPGPRIIIMEFKSPGQRSRKLQVYVNSLLRDLGFTVHEDVTEFEQAMAFLHASEVWDQIINAEILDE
jgi:hypothetical protein